MTTRTSVQTPNIQYVILDTCVVQMAGSNKKEKADAVQNCLKELVTNSFVLSISEISLFENLHGLWGKKAGESAELLHRYEQKTVSNNVLIVASMLGGALCRGKN